MAAIRMGSFSVAKKDGTAILAETTYQDVEVDFGNMELEEILDFLVGQSSSIRVKVQGILRSGWTPEGGFTIKDGAILSYKALYTKKDLASAEETVEARQRARFAGDAERMAALDLIYNS